MGGENGEGRESEGDVSVNSKHRAAIRVERLHIYRGAGSLLMVGGAIAVLVYCTGLDGVWCVAGIAAAVVGAVIGYPIGELLGMLVAQRGLREKEVSILHALRFLDSDPGGPFLRQLHDSDADLTRLWVLSLANDAPEAVHVKRARLGARVLGVQG